MPSTKTNKLSIMNVVFRTFHNGEVIALFPQESDRRTYETLSYMHIGQHGGADYQGVIRMTKPATESEYNPLLRELQMIGYNNLQVRKKAKIKWY